MNPFKLGDIVLKWDARCEDKGKHGKFDELWKGPYSISAFMGRNAFFLEDSEGNRVGVGPVNGRFLKYYSSYVLGGRMKFHHCIYVISFLFESDFKF